MAYSEAMDAYGAKWYNMKALKTTALQASREKAEQAEALLQPLVAAEVEAEAAATPQG